ncbi:hypothetical protein VTK56DRAFT_8015 [Thermocarpiscus australiensis]
MDTSIPTCSKVPQTRFIEQKSPYRGTLQLRQRQGSYFGFEGGCSATPGDNNIIVPESRGLSLKEAWLASWDGRPG